MNILLLRTRFVNDDDFDDTDGPPPQKDPPRKSSWVGRMRRAVTPRFTRPVFISSPAPKKSHARLPRAA